MSEGRKALASLVRKAEDEKRECDKRAAIYRGNDFAAANWHYGFAAGVTFMQIAIEMLLAGKDRG